ncbi:MAG: DUF1080 domain-containing protein [Verrucomicrobiales bacterium]|nr:DUF1080 domain-containing protein [Verrucomicrobiales bacterium]
MRQRTWHWILPTLAIAAAARVGAADAIMGCYEGSYRPDRFRTTRAEAKVIAEGPGYYRVVVQAEPLQAGDATIQFEVFGVQQGNAVQLFGRSSGLRWNGSIRDGKLAANPGYYGMGLELTKTEKKSPTEGAKPPADAVVLLPYEPGRPTDGSAWKGGAWKALEDGSYQCEPNKGSINSKQEFGDIRLHLEFWLPLMPDAFGQGRANSGVILNTLYEVQVLDSFGLVPSAGDCGGIYDNYRPKVNASFPPETWQTYDIVFRGPRMNPDGTVREKARITVDLNGVRVQENVSIEGATAGHPPGKPPANAERGPLHLQDHGNRVRYRNVWLQELKDAAP